MGAYARKTGFDDDGVRAELRELNKSQRRLSDHDLLIKTAATVNGHSWALGIIITMLGIVLAKLLGA